MDNKISIPLSDGYHMPAEYELHKGCIMIWPQRPGSWKNDTTAAERAFEDVIRAIVRSEKVYLAVGKKAFARAAEFAQDLDNVIVFETETDDSWARDMAPTFVVNGKNVRAVNWEFNAWGGDVDGLYANWQLDNAFAKKFAAEQGYICYDAAPFVLEGGSIHSDGEGTVMVTEACLLSKGRNPELNKEEIEDRLKEYLGAQKVLWLPRGIYMDETNEHVDNVCAFIGPAEVVLAWTENKNDPQYELSMENFKYLESQCDAKGRPIQIHKLPVPDVPVCVTEEDVKGYGFEPGEDVREIGDRLAASYVNFYFSNGAIVMPIFGGVNEESDKRAVQIMRELCPEREIITVYAREILAGGGNIHCITQQIPEGNCEEGEHNEKS